MKRMFLIVMIVIAVVPALAQERERTVRHSAQGPSLVTYLALTQAQLQAIEQMRKAQDGTMGVLVSQMRQKQEELQQGIQRGDAAAIGRAQIELDAARKQTELAHKQLREQIFASLNADQQAKLTALQEAARVMPLIEQAARLGLLTTPEGGIRHEAGGGGVPGGTVRHSARPEGAAPQLLPHETSVRSQRFFH